MGYQNPRQQGHFCGEVHVKRISNRANTGNGNHKSVRLSGYVTPAEKKTWMERVAEASEIEGLRNPDSGTFLSRIIKFGLRLDLASMAQYGRITKRRRDQNPARPQPSKN
jgi:hypothetical protein